MPSSRPPSREEIATAAKDLHEWQELAKFYEDELKKNKSFTDPAQHQSAVGYINGARKAEHEAFKRYTALLAREAVSIMEPVDNSGRSLDESAWESTETPFEESTGTPAEESTGTSAEESIEVDRDNPGLPAQVNERTTSAKPIEQTTVRAKRFFDRIAQSRSQPVLQKPNDWPSAGAYYLRDGEPPVL